MKCGNGCETGIGVKTLEPNATILDGLTISRDRIQDAEQEITDWVRGLNK